MKGYTQAVRRMRSSAAKGTGGRGWRYFQTNYQLYLMLVLPICYFLVFKYLPMLGTTIAFKDYNMFQGMFGGEWVGLAHFKEAFSSSTFWLALKNTLILNMGDLLLSFPIPIILAVALNELYNEKIKKTTQVITYLPHFLSWVIIGGIVFQIFSNTGLINNVLASIGLDRVDFLSDPHNWRIVYWVAGIWQSAGYSLIIYLAALMGVDPSLGEAAYIDGANKIQRIWHVTLPMIKPTIVVMLVMNLGSIMSIGFERPYLLGNVMVSDVSTVISTYVYQTGLQAARFDFAAAVGLFQAVVGVVMILTANAITKRMGEEGLM